MFHVKPGSPGRRRAGEPCPTVVRHGTPSSWGGRSVSRPRPSMPTPARSDEHPWEPGALGDCLHCVRVGSRHRAPIRPFRPRALGQVRRRGWTRRGRPHPGPASRRSGPAGRPGPGRWRATDTADGTAQRKLQPAGSPPVAGRAARPCRPTVARPAQRSVHTRAAQWSAPGRAPRVIVPGRPPRADTSPGTGCPRRGPDVPAAPDDHDPAMPHRPPQGLVNGPTGVRSVGSRSP